MTRLASIAFGRLCRDRTFSAEEFITGDWRVDCSTENHQVELSKFEESSFGSGLFSIESQLSIKYLARHIVALAASGRLAGQSLVFLEAHCPPLFENASTSVLGDHTARLPSPTGHGEMRPVMRCICLTFTTPRDQEGFIRSCKGLHLPRCVTVHTRIVRKNLYHRDNLRLLENFCQLLCFDLAFEVQKSFSSGLLDPRELCVLLKDQILQLQQQSEYHAVLILRHFASTLNFPTFARKYGRRRRATTTVPSLPDLLRKAASEYQARLAQHRNILSPPPAIVQSYHVIVTPSSWILEGPLPDRGNGES